MASVGSRALANRTNIPCLFNPLSTSPNDAPPKRVFHGFDAAPRKKPKISQDARHAVVVDSDTESEDDVEMDDVATEIARARKGTLFKMMQSRYTTPWRSHGRPCVSTQPILESFVSSQKADVYTCEAREEGYAPTVPYACSFSNVKLLAFPPPSNQAYLASKSGTASRLAFATEQGSIHVVDTTKRYDWEQEPPRTVFQAHDNGVFDIRWSTDDALLATASGDQTARVSCPETSSVLWCLRDNSSTIKCVTWDPHHRHVLSSGSRDGTISLWDLRVSGPSAADGTTYLCPVMTLPGAHNETKRARGRKSKGMPAAPSVTSLLYPESQPFQLVSSGSGDGLLKCWDLRQAMSAKKPKAPAALFKSPLDPTTFHGSRRPRGITSIVGGHDATDGLVFALGTDSYVHAYVTPSLMPQPHGYTHESMSTNSFYVRLALSPCGRWLASGGAGPCGTAFLYDVSNAARPATAVGGGTVKGVKLSGQKGEIGAVDWAEGMLATCADDGTVRVWRPDLAIHRSCEEDPTEKQWEWRWATRA